MVCILCLKNSSAVLEIFNDNGQELKIATVIGKHFWFEPKNGDSVSSHICHSCWTKVSDFHEFYKYVEKAQQLFAVEVIVKTEYTLTVCDVTVQDVELASKHELEHNIEEQYEEPFNITSDVLTEDDFEFPPDFKDEFLDIVNNEKKKDDQDISAMHDDKEDKSGLQIQIKEKKKIFRKKGTEIKRPSKRNKVELLTEETTTTHKRHERPRKGEVDPLKNKSNCNEEKAAKLEIYNGPSGSNVATQEMSAIINRKISEYMQLQCDVCGTELDTFDHIKNHMTSVHGIRPYVKCCEKKFSWRSGLYDHIMFHLNPDIYKCEKCYKVFSDKLNLSRHDIYMHQSEVSKIFQCPQCPEKFPRKYLLQAHKTRQHNNGLRYFCKECKRGFFLKSGLTSHVALRHGTKCDVCSEVVKGAVAFKRHQLKHQRIVDLCGSRHKDELSLTRRNSLHIYQSDGKYVCNICNKSYTRANTLKEHMSQHTGLSLYRCPHCSRTFNHMSNMHKHLKRMHPKEFEYRKLRKISARCKESIIPTISSLSDATNISGELPIKHLLDENIEEPYEEPFNVTSHVLAEENYGAIEFEFPPDLKHQSVDIVHNEEKKDDQDISANCEEKSHETQKIP